MNGTTQFFLSHCRIEAIILCQILIAIEAPDALRRLAEQHHLTAIYAFGSRAKDIAAIAAGEAVSDAHSHSDADIGVLPERGHCPSIRDRIAIEQALEDTLHAEQLDLVILTEANPFLALEIVRGELLYSTRPDEEAEYQLFVLRRAGDLAPFQKERLRLILSGEAI